MYRQVGPARSHDYPAGDGLHQSAGDRKGNGRFVHEVRGTRLRRRSLIGVKRQQLADSLKSLQAGGNSAKLFKILKQIIEDGAGVLSRMLRSF